MRLQEFIQQTCQLSSRRARQKINQGRVTVDGEYIGNGNYLVDPAWHAICLEGQPLPSHLGHQNYLLYKRPGLVSARRDRQYATVFDDLPKDLHDLGLSIVGRLDRDAQGLILLTNNGQLHYLLENPRFQIPKTYRVRVNGALDNQDVAAFEAGILWSDGYLCQAAQLQLEEVGDQVSQARLTIYEGKRHQIKKMFLARGLKVIYLERLAIGPLSLDRHPLQEGSCRPLEADEIADLKALVKRVQR
ncbi:MULTISPECIES: pseudouridine synthase [Aerococcus]|uniref:Pseudouridine synthase n=1 Tax=Aerococcus sanguinicola TaxID=119206 RepID=A0A5N1GLS4_9LACT|nr:MULTISPECIES: pseudouridine synthase [Aerococcus]KAA9301238.1 rRNA pseudouridine synthase [Aerococcus sanguinicola]MDK6369226.1 pseudouridine synthase [Aerococcus sp. UMB9870]MDK6679050.1 pseudouridine synthase [Aerococcus sp. UMB8608]MDK6686958.1 pseudouridine synthase [Aerococcus sp. UMB8623]MDK6940112.1 pseudouridine synthase [Aerococcus sp. UMB8487]